MRFRLGCLSLLFFVLLAAALPFLYIGLLNTALFNHYRLKGGRFLVD
jgi:hypothetical protein